MNRHLAIGICELFMSDPDISHAHTLYTRADNHILDIIGEGPNSELL